MLESIESWFDMAAQNHSKGYAGTGKGIIVFAMCPIESKMWAKVIAVALSAISGWQIRRVLRAWRGDKDTDARGSLTVRTAHSGGETVQTAVRGLTLRRSRVEL
jgi:hypothetical protein